MRIIDIAIIFVSHTLAALPFVRRLLRGYRPSTNDFAILSFILYYDLGLALELFGYTYNSEFFAPLLGADDVTFLFATILIAAAPWLLHAGAAFTNPHPEEQPLEPTTGIQPDRRFAFYGLAALVIVPLVLYALNLIAQGNTIYLTRLDVTASWGPLIVLLYLPLHFLGFYVAQRDSRSWWGLLVCLALAGAAVLSTLVIGQRTLVLLPFLILVLFRLRLTPARLMGATALLLVTAAVLLSIFKFTYAQSNLEAAELVSETISGDIARAPVIRTAIELADPLGTHILPYPMSGYVYSTFFFVPRQFAPFKGVSTAQYVTGYLAGTDPEITDWGVGVGMIEELMLNGGLLLVIPGLIAYGMGMGYLDRATRRLPSLVVPTRLAAIWLCGYNLPAVLLTFGLMAIVCVALHMLFVARYGERAVAVPA